MEDINILVYLILSPDVRHGLHPLLAIIVRNSSANFVKLSSFLRPSVLRWRNREQSNEYGLRLNWGQAQP